MSTAIRFLSSSPLASPRIAVAVSGAGLLLGMLAGAMAPNSETAPVALPLSRPLPSLGPHGAVAPGLMYTGDFVACLGLAGMLWAHSRGWRPDPRRLLIGSGAVVAIMVNLSPVGSSDIASDAAYGRIAAQAGNPYLTSPLAAHHPHYLAIVDTMWEHTPSVYGPVATAVQAFAASVGSASPAVTIWVLMVLNGAVFLGTGLLLLLTSDDPVRATLLWTANPLLLQQLVGGGHLDTYVAAASVGAIQVLRRCGTARGDVLAGVLLGLACGIKASAALVLAGLTWALLQRHEWLRITRMITASLATVAAAYAWYGPDALRPMLGSLKLTSLLSPWQLLRLTGQASGITGTAATVTISALWPVALIVVAWLVGRRISADQPREVVVPFALSYAWVLVAPWALAWYTATAWVLLTQLPRNRMTRWLTLVTLVLALCLSRGGHVHPGH